MIKTIVAIVLCVRVCSSDGTPLYWATVHATCAEALQFAVSDARLGIQGAIVSIHDDWRSLVPDRELCKRASLRSPLDMKASDE